MSGPRVNAGTACFAAVARAVARAVVRDAVERAARAFRASSERSIDLAASNGREDSTFLAESWSDLAASCSDWRKDEGARGGWLAAAATRGRTSRSSMNTELPQFVQNERFGSTLRSHDPQIMAACYAISAADKIFCPMTD